MRFSWRRSRPRGEPSSMRETLDFLADSFPPVGREEDKRTILDLLEVDGNHVVTIHGIGGSGKTTLAKLVYDAVDRFDLKIRICVSNSFEFGKVIKKILDGLGVTGRESVGQLEAKLRDRLRGKRFLVVLDDLWSDDEAKWREFANLLMESSNQAKIIVTTREQSVVNMIDTVSTGMVTVSSHHLHVLSNDDLLSLLERYVVWKGQDVIPNELKQIGRKIVADCEGLPLAVKILAVLLSERIEATYWESIRDGNHFELLLRLSRDLPVYCKDRFFYFLPLLHNENEMQYEDLFDLWMTDGLFESLDQEMSLIVVEKELESIIQQKHWDILRGLICHPTIIRRLAENKWPVKTASNDEVGDHAVHLSIGCHDDLNHLGKLNGLQTLFLWGCKGSFFRKLFSKKRVSKFKLLRVLVLKRSAFKLPSRIDNISHLKCLNLSWNSGMKELPSFIFKLRSLEILKLEGCHRLETLPRDIKKLSGLKVLSITVKKMDYPSGIGHLTSLQSLLIGECKTSLPISMYLTHLTALQSLTIYGCPNLVFTEEGAASESLLELKLEHLENLEVLPLRTKCLLFLHIKHCGKLRHLSHCLPAMPVERIVIESCRQLDHLPENMADLERLRILEIGYCPDLKSYLEEIMKDEDKKKYFEDRLHIKG